ncbi:MAG: DUF1624 domain-containing protein [Pseudomonadota bacterium]
MNPKAISPKGAPDFWRPRYPLVDILRGTAIVMMAVYHFTFDLRYYGVIDSDFNHDPFWLGFRTLIVSLFLGLAGVSLHLATAQGIRWRPYLRRLSLVAGCAVLVSLASYIMFPRSMIFFGILHFIAVASVLGLLFVRLFWGNLALGIGLLALGLRFKHAWFDQPAWQWLGLMTHKPVTEDYVPLLPWFGVVLIGLFLGRLVYSGGDAPAFARWRGEQPVARLLAWGGKHSLMIYMLHQPVFFAILYVFLGK